MQNVEVRILFLKLLVLPVFVVVLTWGIGGRGCRVGERVYQIVRMSFIFSWLSFIVRKTYLILPRGLTCDQGLESLYNKVQVKLDHNKIVKYYFRTC